MGHRQGGARGLKEPPLGSTPGAWELLKLFVKTDGSASCQRQPGHVAHVPCEDILATQRLG